VARLAFWVARDAHAEKRPEPIVNNLTPLSVLFWVQNLDLVCIAQASMPMPNNNLDALPAYPGSADAQYFAHLGSPSRHNITNVTASATAAVSRVAGVME
jgi:hypothetical protein